MRLELFRADELLVGRSGASLEELDGLPGLFGHTRLASYDFISYSIIYIYNI